MIETFGHMAAGFNDMKVAKNLNIPFADSRGYFWRIGTDARVAWEPEFEQKVSDAKPQEIESYKAMFLENSELLGIPVAKELSDFRGIRLYKLNEQSNTSTLNDILCSYNGNILSNINTLIDDPITNEQINQIITIKPESLKMTSCFDAVDVITSKTSGLIYGEDFKNSKRNDNRLNGESIMGTINYKDGKIQLIRSSSKNDELIPAYESFVVASAASSGGSDGSSGGSSGPVAPTELLVRINPTISFTTFVGPATVVWEFMLDS